MDSRTITLIASIAVIGLVAIGAGYAYTALSINDGNNAAAQYVTLTQDSYTFTTNPNSYFDSCTDSTNTGYKVTTDAGVTGYKLATLGTVTLTATTTGFSPEPSLVLSIDDAKSSGFTPGTKYTYYLLDENDDIVGKLMPVAQSTPVWKNAAGNAAFTVDFPAVSQHTSEVTLKLCYGYADTAATWDPFNEDDQGDKVYVVGETPANLTNGKIVFAANPAV